MPTMPTYKRRRFGSPAKVKPKGLPALCEEDVPSNVYNLYVWKVSRATYLDEHWYCVECAKVGLWVVATVVDHVWPIRLGGAMWDTGNWQSLCETCHNQKRGKEAHVYHRLRYGAAGEGNKGQGSGYG